MLSLARRTLVARRSVAAAGQQLRAYHENIVLVHTGQQGVVKTKERSLCFVSSHSSPECNGNVFPRVRLLHGQACRPEYVRALMNDRLLELCHAVAVQFPPVP